MVGRQKPPMMRTLCAATWLLLLPVARPAPHQAPDPLAARTKGSSGAPITVYEMSDFQCPYCREFALNTMPKLERQYIRTGKVRFIYINLPLINVHKNAAAAAQAAMC